MSGATRARGIAVVGAALVALTVGAFYLARPAGSAPGADLRLALALALSTGAAALLTGAVFTVLARRRAEPLIAALRRIAAGDFTAALPDVADAAPRVREAVAVVGAALARALTRLDHADGQRRRLFADLAHELATPTAALLGLAETLARPDLCPTEADRARLLAALEAEAMRLARLVDDVRDLANLDDPDVSFARAPADVAAVVADAVARFAAPSEVRVDVEPAVADVDPARLDQVVTNLLANARRHAPPDGTIAVTVRAGAAGATLVVEDSGPGVPEEALPRLGERLFRPDDARDRRAGGHGLGLAIVRAIVRRHDGTIAFDRSPLGGLRVTVTVSRA